MKSPIKKLFVFTNQSSSGSLIYIPTFPEINFSGFSCFVFEVPVEKVLIDGEEVHGIEFDGTLNLENLLEQCSLIKNVGI